MLRDVREGRGPEELDEFGVEGRVDGEEGKEGLCVIKREGLRLFR